MAMSVNSFSCSRSTDHSTERQPATRIKLANGITLVAMQNPTVNVVAVRCFLPAGSRVDLPHQVGLANLVAAVLTRGTSLYDSQAIAIAAESLGAALSTDVTPDYFEISLKCIAADLPDVLKLLKEVLCEPTFPDSEVTREQGLILQGIRSQQERPFSVAFDSIRHHLYPNHPYADSVIGREVTVKQLTREHLTQFHRCYFRPDQLVIAAIGPMPPETLQAEIELALGHWNGTYTSQDNVQLHQSNLAHLECSQLFKTVQDTHQSIIMMGYRGSSVHQADYARLKVLCTYLGQGLSSRLFSELREKLGLAYDVSAIFATRQDPAPFIAYLGTSSANTAYALDCLTSEMKRLIEAPLSEAEVELAKRKLLGHYALSKQTNAQIIQVLGLYEALGLGYEFDQLYPQHILAVTSESLYQAAQTYLKTPVTAVVGPLEALDPI